MTMLRRCLTGLLAVSVLLVAIVSSAHGTDGLEILRFRLE